MNIFETCRSGDCARVLDLLHAGADINAIYDNPDHIHHGQQLLHIAIFVYNIDTVALLVKHGADINGVNYYGNTPLHYSIWVPDDTTILEFLLLAGADVDKQHSYTGNTILHDLTQQRWHMNQVRIVLNHGADAEIKNKKGQTPLDLTKDDDMITLLQEYIESRYAKNAARRK